MAETLLVRIKPYNPKMGCVVRRFMYRHVRFDEENGWYRVPEWLGEELRTIPQRDREPDGVRMFDVMTDAQAKDLEAAERRRRRAAVAQPHEVKMLREPAQGVLTTADLPENQDDADPDLPGERAPDTLDLGDMDDDDDDDEPTPDVTRVSDVAPKPTPPRPAGRRGPPSKKAGKR